MKATIDVPNDLYRQVKAKSALEGRAIRDVTAALFESYLRGEPNSEPSTQLAPPTSSSELRERHLPSWFGIAGRLGARTADPSMDAIRESIARGWAEEVAARERRISKRAAR